MDLNRNNRAKIILFASFSQNFWIPLRLRTVSEYCKNRLKINNSALWCLKSADFGAEYFKNVYFEGAKTETS